MNIELIKQILNDDTIENFQISSEFIIYDRYKQKVSSKTSKTYKKKEENCQISIFEFTHICEKWVLKEGFYIENSPDFLNNIQKIKLYDPASTLIKLYEEKEGKNLGILKACEYVFKLNQIYLNQIEDKKNKDKYNKTKKNNIKENEIKEGEINFDQFDLI